MKRIASAVARNSPWKRVLVAPVIRNDCIIAHKTTREILIGGDPLADYATKRFVLRILSPLEIDSELWYALSHNHSLCDGEYQRYVRSSDFTSPFSWSELLRLMILSNSPAPRGEYLNRNHHYYAITPSILLWATSVPLSSINSVLNRGGNLHSVSRVGSVDTLKEKSTITRWNADPTTPTFCRTFKDPGFTLKY